MALWRAKILIIIITGAFAVVSVIYALIVPNQYEASTVLAPAQQETGGLAGALSQLGGLASLAGVSIGEAEGNEGQMALSILRSFVRAFNNNNSIEVEVFLQMAGILTVINSIDDDL